MEKENKASHSGYEIEDVGQVQIADEVIAVIAGLAATEVDGVQHHLDEREEIAAWFSK